MLKSKKIYKRSKAKKFTLVTLFFVTALSVIAGFTTLGLSINKNKTKSNLIVNQYAQTQEYQNTLLNDYKIVLALSEEKEFEETKESLKNLDTEEYRTEKLLNSQNNIYLEKYNENKKLADSLGMATAYLLATAAVAGTAAKYLQDTKEAEI